MPMRRHRYNKGTFRSAFFMELEAFEKGYADP